MTTGKLLRITILLCSSALNPNLPADKMLHLCTENYQLLFSNREGNFKQKSTYPTREKNLPQLLKIIKIIL